MTDHDWLSSSIMAKRGLASGKERQRHSLTIEEQGDFHYVWTL